MEQPLGMETISPLDFISVMGFAAVIVAVSIHAWASTDPVRIVDLKVIKGICIGSIGVVFLMSGGWVHIIAGLMLTGLSTLSVNGLLRIRRIRIREKNNRH